MCLVSKVFQNYRSINEQHFLWGLDCDRNPCSQKNEKLSQVEKLPELTGERHLCLWLLVETEYSAKKYIFNCKEGLVTS